MQMKTFKEYQAEECYSAAVANCAIPICIFILYRLIKEKINDWKGYKWQNMIKRFMN